MMISVIIPLYNKEKSIKSTIESVLAQTYKDFELVIVNDGSIDESASIVKEILDDRIRLINKNNEGVSSARNTGILAAKGEYIAFLDGDDLWDKMYLETLANLIYEYPNATIYGIGYGWINNGNRAVTRFRYPNTYRGYVSHVWNNYPSCWTGSSSSSSRDNLIKAGLFDARMTHGEDIDMWWRLLLMGRGAVDCTPLAWYRQDSENRAMHKLIPLKRHIPYYIDKYSEYRANDVDFRRFFDLQMLYRLYPYALSTPNDPNLKRILNQIDFSLQKKSMKLRFQFPKLYHLYLKLVGRA